MSEVDNIDSVGRSKRGALADDDAWFADDPLGGMRRGPRKPLSKTLVLGGVIAALLILGLALGAFSSPSAVQPSAVAVVDVEALRASARGHSGLVALDDAELVARLDRLIAVRRAAVPAADTAAPDGPVSDVQAQVAPDAANLAGEPIAIETGETVIAVEPKVVEPKVVEPKVVEPKVVEPKVVEPKVASAVDEALQSAKTAADAGKWGEAKTSYDKVLSLAPGNRKGLLGRGRASFELRQVDLARKDFEAVLAMDPKSSAALLLLGSIAQDQGKKAEAKALYQRYLDAYPDGRKAAEIRALLERL